jgi:DNA-binding MarR family transcriptional regulator
MGGGAGRAEKRTRGKSLVELLMCAERVSAEGFETQIRRHGVSRTEWRVLSALLERDDVSMTELNKELELRQPTLSKIVARLEKIGLIERRAPNDDRRRKLVCLTGHGRSVAAPLLAQAREHDAEVCRTFGQAKSRELKAALMKLISLLQRQQDEKRSG